jgi:hypothetical protein
MKRFSFFEILVEGVKSVKIVTCRILLGWVYG